MLNMLKKQRLNKKKSEQRVWGNIEELKNKPQTLESIYDVIFKYPDFVYLEQVGDFGVDEYTYEDIDKQNKRYASYFSKVIKGKNKYVGILLENSNEWISSFFGLLLSGFTPVLFSTLNSENEVINVTKRIDIEYLITDRKHLKENFKVINPYEIPYEEVSYESKTFSNEIIFLTSGTTGEPKIVFYTGKEICNQLYKAKPIFETNPSFGENYKGYFKHLVILPFYHVFGLIAVLLWFSFLNVTFVLPKNLNPKSIKDACNLCKPSHIFAVPAFWHTISASIMNKVNENKKNVSKFNKALKISTFIQNKFGLKGTNFVRDVLFKKYLNKILGTSIRYCISGGAHIDSESLTLINTLGYSLNNGYGSTETGIVSFANSNSLKSRCINSIGYPIENVDLKIENDELLISCDTHSKHIIFNEKEEFYQDGDYFHSNDIVKNDNGIITIIGRKDEIVVNNSGENISLSSIENELVLPMAKEYSVIFDNETKRFILIGSYTKKINIEDAFKELNGMLKKHKKILSNAYYTYKAFPKANGLKIKRIDLLEDLKKNPNEYFDIKKDKPEKIDQELDENLLNEIIEAFKSVFPKDTVAENTNFYLDLGGDSLKYFLLLNVISESIGVDLNINDFKDVPYTPKEFVEAIKKL